jgi:hypothetical protein
MDDVLTGKIAGRLRHFRVGQVGVAPDTGGVRAGAARRRVIRRT